MILSAVAGVTYVVSIFALSGMRYPTHLTAALKDWFMVRTGVNRLAWVNRLRNRKASRENEPLDVEQLRGNIPRPIRFEPEATPPNTAWSGRPSLEV